MIDWTFPLVQLFKKDPDSEQLTIYPCFLNLSALSTSSNFMAILFKIKDKQLLILETWAQISHYEVV